MKPVEIEFLIQNHTKSGLSEVSSGVDAVQQDAEQTQAVLASLREEIARLHAQMKDNPTIDQSESIAMIDALKAKIGELEAELKKTGAALPKLGETAAGVRLTPKDLPNAKRSFNGLNFSIQQIAREMPTLAMGPQMFFMAISNNLPIFADELQRARGEYDALVASGQKGIPVWKQILKSLFSWQTAMTAGIMLTVMYGKEIGAWVSELFQGKKALDATRLSSEQYNSTMTEGAKNAQDEVVKLRLLYDAAIDNKRSMDDRREAVNRLKEEYPNYFKHLSDEQILVGNASNAYKELVSNIYEYAKAQAAFRSMVNLEQQGQMLDGTGLMDSYNASAEKYKKTLSALAAATEAYNNTEWTKRGNATPVYENKMVASAYNINAEKELEIIQEKVLGELGKYTGGQEFLDVLKNQFDNNLDAYLQFADDQRKKLEKIADNAFIKTDPTKPPKPTKPTTDNTSDLERLSDMEVAARQRVEEQVVALMKEGYDKQRAEAELNFRKEKERITKEEQERLALVEKLRKSGVNINPGAEAGIRADAATQRIQAAQGFDTTNTNIDKREQVDAAKRQAQKEKELNELLAKYRDFEAQRAATKEQGDADIAKLNTQRTEANSQEIDRAIAIVKTKVEQGLQSINNAELASAKGTATTLVSLFADASQKSTGEIRKIIRASEDLYNYLQQTPTQDVTSQFGISADNLSRIKESPEQLKALQDAIRRLKKELAGKSPFSAFSEALQDAIGNIKKGDIGQGLMGIGSAIDIIKPAVKQFGNDLSAIFGDSQIGEDIGILMDTIGGVGTAVGGIGQIMSGDILGGVTSVASGLASIFSMAAASEARHKEALKEIEAAKLNFQNQYNLLLIKQNLLLAQASNIFGERQITKAANAVRNYQNAFAQLKEGMKGDAPTMNKFEQWSDDAFGTYARRMAQYEQGVYGLASANIVTGHKKTGLFGWGKGKDVYGNILDAYPELIAQNGELDTEMLKVILDTRKMSDQTRAYLQNIVDLKGAMEEAEKALEDYLQQTFGSLGSGIMDSITTALRGGDAALENFADKAASIFEQLGEQVAYSLFFADKFDQLQNQLKGVYGSGKSDEQIANDAMNMIDSFYDNIGSNVDSAQKWMEEWRKKAEEMGYDLWKDDGTTQSGKTGAFTTMTQDQGTKLEGLFTSLQMHAVSLDEKMDNITSGLGGCLDALTKIATNTDTLPLMLALWQTIKRDGLKMK